MDEQTVDDRCWTSRDFLVGQAQALALHFHGLGDPGLRSYPDQLELELGEAGVLVAQPYYGPWAWMNPAARRFVDELVPALRRVHGLPADAPLICFGGSMGGHASLLYARYASHPLAAVYANCPVTDLAFHYRERADTPRAVRHALADCGDFSTALREHSPLLQVDHMPRVPYWIVHGERDGAVSRAAHSEPFVTAMRAAGHEIHYEAVEGMGHCQPVPIALQTRVRDFLLAAAGLTT